MVFQTSNKSNKWIDVINVRINFMFLWIDKVVISVLLSLFLWLLLAWNVLMIIERIKEVKERMIRRNFIDYFEGIIEWRFDKEFEVFDKLYTT
jgi:hypothetical protein